MEGSHAFSFNALCKFLFPFKLQLNYHLFCKAFSDPNPALWLVVASALSLTFWVHLSWQWWPCIAVVWDEYIFLLGLYLLSVQFSRSVVPDPLRSLELQHTSPPCPSSIPGVHSDSCPSSQWCHPAISSSVVPFSRPQSLPASGSFPMSQLFTWGGQSIAVSASASVLPMNTQDWSPLGWTGWISLQSKGLARDFSSTTVQKHQFFGAQPSSQSNSHIHTWPQEKP